MIWFLSFCFIPSLVFAAGNLRSAYFKSSKNKYLAGQAVKKIDSPSLISCCQACLGHSWCTSANFKESFGMSSNGSCELIKQQFSPVRDKAKLTDRPGTTFTRKMVRIVLCQIYIARIPRWIPKDPRSLFELAGLKSSYFVVVEDALWIEYGEDGYYNLLFKIILSWRLW